MRTLKNICNSKFSKNEVAKSHGPHYRSEGCGRETLPQSWLLAYFYFKIIINFKEKLAGGFPFFFFLIYELILLLFIIYFVF